MNTLTHESLNVENQISTVVLENYQNYAANYSKGTPILINFVNLSTIFCTWL